MIVIVSVTKKYREFVKSSPAIYKRGGVCSGACYTWLASNMRTRNINRYTQDALLNSSTEFYEKAFSAQRYASRGGTFSIFMQKIEAHNAIAKNSGLPALQIEMIGFFNEQRSYLENFFREKNGKTQGMIFSIDYGDNLDLHAVALLKINNKIYWYDPNRAVYLLGEHDGFGKVATMLRLTYGRVTFISGYIVKFTI